MLADGKCSFVQKYLFSVGLMAAWSMSTMATFAQTETETSRPAPPAAQLPLPLSPSALETGARWLRMALAPSRSAEVPADRLPFEAIRDKRGSVIQGSALGNYSGNVSDQDEFHRLVSEYARQDQEREAQAAEEYSLPPIQQFLPTDPLQSATDQLRNSARNLDTAANDLEDAGNYVAADRLRSSAQRLRREARELGKQTVAELKTGITR